MSVSEKNVKRKLTDIIRSTGNGAVIAISTCFLLFVYAPTELFLTNQSSFWFTLYTMLPAVLGTFAVTVLASVLLLFFCNLISHTLYQIASAGFALLMICSYIQGTFLIFGLPGLDGLAIDWNQYQASRYKSIGLWIIMLIVFIVLIRIFHLRKFLKVAGIVSFCMALMLLVTLFTLSLSSRDSLNKDVLTATTENMFEMSKDTNFIILLLDAVDAPTLNQMIADGNMEGLEDTFEDFTYYTNTVGAYSCTKHAVPYILSGFWYENDRTYNDYLNTVFEDSPTMYQDVIQGNSVACVEDKPIIQDWIVSKGLALKTVDAMESDPAPYGFAIMNEANQPLLDMFNAGLADIKANGTYDEILAKYLGESK